MLLHVKGRVFSACVASEKGDIFAEDIFYYFYFGLRAFPQKLEPRYIAENKHKFYLGGFDAP